MKEIQVPIEDTSYMDTMPLLEACVHCPEYEAYGISACADCIYGDETGPLSDSEIR